MKREFNQNSLPLYNEIPGVGLFLEQVSKYISEYLNKMGVQELTGSMISNYVKKKIIDNPVKKQYGREQIAYLIFIAIAKTVLSLEDINMLLTMQRNISDVEKAYDYFRTEFINILSVISNKGTVSLADGEMDSDDENSLIRQYVRNVMVTAAHKINLDNTFEQLKADSEAKEKFEEEE